MRLIILLAHHLANHKQFQIFPILKYFPIISWSSTIVNYFTHKWMNYFIIRHLNLTFSQTTEMEWKIMTYFLVLFSFCALFVQQNRIALISEMFIQKSIHIPIKVNADVCKCKTVKMYCFHYIHSCMVKKLTLIRGVLEED